MGISLDLVSVECVLRLPPGQQYLPFHYWQRIVLMAMQPGLFNLYIGLSGFGTVGSFGELGD